MVRYHVLERGMQAWRSVVATCAAVRLAQQEARRARLQDIATTFHILFRHHSIIQAWHSTAQRAKHERLQLQHEADEQRQEVTKGTAASQFHALYTKHSFWRLWVEVVQQDRAARELELQHQARQHSIQRFVQASTECQSDSNHAIAV